MLRYITMLPRLFCLSTIGLLLQVKISHTSYALDLAVAFTTVMVGEKWGLWEDFSQEMLIFGGKVLNWRVIMSFCTLKQIRKCGKFNLLPGKLSYFPALATIS